MEGLFVKKNHLMILLLNVYPLYYYQCSITRFIYYKIVCLVLVSALNNISLYVELKHNTLFKRLEGYTNYLNKSDKQGFELQMISSLSVEIVLRHQTV